MNLPQRFINVFYLTWRISLQCRVKNKKGDVSYESQCTLYMHTYMYVSALTSKALHTGRPPYLSDLLQHHEPTRSLRSSSSRKVSVPRHNLTFGSRALVFRFRSLELNE